MRIVAGKDETPAKNNELNVKEVKKTPILDSSHIFNKINVFLLTYFPKSKIGLCFDTILFNHIKFRYD